MKETENNYSDKKNTVHSGKEVQKKKEEEENESIQ